MEDPQDTNVAINDNSNIQTLQIAPTKYDVPQETQVAVQSAVAAVLVDIPALNRCIYRVPIHMREGRNRNMREYDPVLLSLGPYHHGKRKYRRMEQFKKGVLDKFIENSMAKDATKDSNFFYNSILERINEVRANYEEVKYNDKDFTQIILCDACFLLCYMDETNKTSSVDTYYEITNQLGWSVVEFVKRDIWLLENQIPFWIIQHLFYLRFDENKANEFVYDQYLRGFGLDDKRITSFPWDDKGESQPLHLLEARRITLLTPDSAPNKVSFKCIENWKSCWTSSRSADSSDEIIIPAERCWNLPNHSVTSLQSKGIYFRPSSECLRDIKFTSYHFYGVLYLPILLVGASTNVFFQNDIAFELSPNDKTDVIMLAYVTFMKSLIETAKDVKELRRRGIIHTRSHSDEEVVKVFKELDIVGTGGFCVFFDVVSRQIDKHCQTKAKTWMAELYHTYCRSPWAAIAIFAATAVLVLTFLQTYYTIHSVP